MSLSQSFPGMPGHGHFYVFMIFVQNKVGPPLFSQPMSNEKLPKVVVMGKHAMRQEKL